MFAGFAGRVAWLSYQSLQLQRSGVPSAMKLVNKLKKYRGPFESTLDRKEAALILNVKPAATTKEVRAAHRRLMMLNHPDKGGSKFIAMKINQSKDLLMGSGRR